MFRSLKKNKQGIVLITVLVVSIILIVIAVSLIGYLVILVTKSEEEKNIILLHNFLEGLGWVAFAQRASGNNVNSLTITKTIDGKQAVGTINFSYDGSGPLGTDPITITVQYQ